jgi:hypothetical protein
MVNSEKLKGTTLGDLYYARITRLREDVANELKARIEFLRQNLSDELSDKELLDMALNLPPTYAQAKRDGEIIRSEIQETVRRKETGWTEALIETADERRARLNSISRQAGIEKGQWTRNINDVFSALRGKRGEETAATPAEPKSDLPGFLVERGNQVAHQPIKNTWSIVSGTLNNELVQGEQHALPSTGVKDGSKLPAIDQESSNQSSLKNILYGNNKSAR